MSVLGKELSTVEDEIGVGNDCLFNAGVAWVLGVRRVGELEPSTFSIFATLQVLVLRVQGEPLGGVTGGG